MTIELKQIEEKRTKSLQAARRVVIKLGTSLVTNKQGDLNLEHLEPIVRDVAILSRSGRQIVLVSSGAVGFGPGAQGRCSNEAGMRGCWSEFADGGVRKTVPNPQA